MFKGTSPDIEVSLCKWCQSESEATIDGEMSATIQSIVVSKNIDSLLNLASRYGQKDHFIIFLFYGLWIIT